ncbi:flagellar motor protein MotA [Alphaproteobacteria bacterium]|nr:flagellar motor protein MotA [Alphaproteobacteria bacterium]GHS98449.1 flagellar motor protein MotA [Alphaproteobacteria bacterium]
MYLLVGLIFVGGGFYFQKLTPLFLYNPLLNSFILATFLGGLVIPFVQLWHLASDQRVFRTLRSGQPLMEWQEKSVLKSFWVNEEGVTKKKISLEEAQTFLASFERQLDERHTFTKYLCSVLILLGLLGTFWGLTQTVGSITEALKSVSFSGALANEAFEHMKAGIQAPLSGMGVAFSSSIFGLVGSLILGYLDLQQGVVEKDFRNEVEEDLLNKTQMFFQQNAQNNGPAYVLALLEQTAETLDLLNNHLLKAEESRQRTSLLFQKMIEIFSESASFSHKNQETIQALVKTEGDMRQTVLQLTQALQAKTNDDSRSSELRALRACCERILEETVSGREQSTRILKDEIRMILKTLSLLAEPEEDYAEAPTPAVAAG